MFIKNQKFINRQSRARTMGALVPDFVKTKEKLVSLPFPGSYDKLRGGGYAAERRRYNPKLMLKMNNEMRAY